MKASHLKRIDILEQKLLPQLAKPFLILHEGDPEPNNTDDYSRVIRFRVVDAVKPEYLKITRGSNN
ncbi:MAG: hypothetical protein QM504_17870 [Pseudomonadota bacterium]